MLGIIYRGDFDEASIRSLMDKEIPKIKIAKSKISTSEPSLNVDK